MSAVGIVALALACYAALALPPLGWRRTAALVGALTIGAAALWAATQVAPATGLKASYWPGTSPNGAPERSTDFPMLSTTATRIEPTNAFEIKGEDFGVHFFNDAARFNFGPDVVPGRDQLSFSVHWDGWLLVPSDGARRFAVDANGPAELSIDGANPGDAPLNLSTGLHALSVAYTRPEAQVPAIRVRWQRD